MDLFKPVFLHMSQSVSFVPSSREHVERNLSANRVCEPIGRELILKRFDKFGTDFVLIIIGREAESLLIPDVLLIMGKENKSMAYVALRPMGDTLIMPFLNSTNVPLINDMTL